MILGRYWFHISLRTISGTFFLFSAKIRNGGNKVYKERLLFPPVDGMKEVPRGDWEHGMVLESIVSRHGKVLGSMV